LAIFDIESDRHTGALSFPKTAPAGTLVRGPLHPDGHFPDQFLLHHLVPDCPAGT
jgi:hypothetical protein